MANTTSKLTEWGETMKHRRRNCIGGAGRGGGALLTLSLPEKTNENFATRGHAPSCPRHRLVMKLWEAWTGPSLVMTPVRQVINVPLSPTYNPSIAMEM